MTILTLQLGIGVPNNTPHPPINPTLHLFTELSQKKQECTFSWDGTNHPNQLFQCTLCSICWSNDGKCAIPYWSDLDCLWCGFSTLEDDIMKEWRGCPLVGIWINFLWQYNGSVLVQGALIGDLLTVMVNVIFHHLTQIWHIVYNTVVTINRKIMHKKHVW